MPSWFNKVFKGSDRGGESKRSSGAATTYARPNPILAAEAEAEAEHARKIIEPAIIERARDEAFAVEGTRAEICIKAAVTDRGRSCVFMVDRPVFDGYSLWLPNAQDAANYSPLGQAIFALEGVEQVEFYHMNVTVTLSQYSNRRWESFAKDVGETIREHLKSGGAVVTKAFLDGLPSEDAIRAKLEKVIETEINPSIAGHSGAIALNRVEGNTVFLRMMGGCQGCAASDVTLKMGIHGAFREAVPQIGAILDETEHSKGTNPFYASLPAGMRADA